MKRNKKGFTLIELLAVIVILAIIALIAVPVIMNVINKANKSAFKDTAYGVISAGELYFAEQQLELNGMSNDETFVWPDDTKTLQVKGNVPYGTVLQVNTKGETALAMSNGRYCVTKGYNDKDITITEEVENCKIPSGSGEKTLSQLATTSETLGVTEVNACVQKGQVCAVSKTNPISFAIRVNEEETYKFYVINDDGNTITLIMNQNLYEDGNTTEPDVAWISKADYETENNKDETPDACIHASCNDEGPITAINALDARTSDWDYITAKPYTYSGIAHNGTTKKYEDITKTMRARMLTYGEATTLECTPGDCPSWLYENLYNGGDNNSYKYWTSTASVSGSGNAWYVRHYGNLDYSSDQVGSPGGLRPVIELSK